MENQNEAFTIYALDYYDAVTGVVSTFEYGIN